MSASGLCVGVNTQHLKNNNRKTYSTPVTSPWHGLLQNWTLVGFIFNYYGTKELITDNGTPVNTSTNVVVKKKKTWLLTQMNQHKDSLQTVLCGQPTLSWFTVCGCQMSIFLPQNKLHLHDGLEISYRFDIHHCFTETVMVHWWYDVRYSIVIIPLDLALKVTTVWGKI